MSNNSWIGRLHRTGEDLLRDLEAVHAKVRVHDVARRKLLDEFVSTHPLIRHALTAGHAARLAVTMVFVWIVATALLTGDMPGVGAALLLGLSARTAVAFLRSLVRRTVS